jgi:hypothetical protein
MQAEFQGGSVSEAMHFWLLLLRQDTKYTKFNIKRLRHLNRTSQSPVVASGGPVVSLTTFGPRLETVHLTIESIGAGALLPSRLILWIQDSQTFQNRPQSVRNLEARGLEVRLTKEYRSHTKYFPYLLSNDAFNGPLATADDDVLYASWWLAGLAKAHDQDPTAIHCYRAHRMRLVNGAINPYLKWQVCNSTTPSQLTFATGSGGVIYPAEFLAHLKGAGDQFLTLCPKADDVWLHVNALRAGFKIRQISHKRVEFPAIPGTEETGLFHSNWTQGNDEQIKKTYTAEDIARLIAAGEQDERAGAPGERYTPADPATGNGKS